MSIASPRPSLNLPSSRRTSTSTINSIRSSSTIRDTNTPTPATARRRDRAALREFYNLQAAAASDAANPPPNHTLQPEDQGPQDALSALDSASFDPNTYITNLLETSSAETLLRTLNAITISSLGLEGDKKALVYDNYTTLLSATSTISRMRENVDPMAPVTTTLEPAVGHIVDVAVGIAGQRKIGDGKEGQRELVRWVLGAPERLKSLKEEGKEEEMRREWERVKELLGKWEGVKGVEEVRGKCEEVVGVV
ncbi:hypothetical protein E4T42_05649 [Aureobasidium subglaciale]|nr:hypothetical protein E4T42_05649 [Aureobasidium subglaciale]